jgi:hypothetical protein
LESERPRVISAYGLGVGEIKTRIQGANQSLVRRKWLQEYKIYVTIIHMFIRKKLNSSPQPSKDNPLSMKLIN